MGGRSSSSSSVTVSPVSITVSPVLGERREDQWRPMSLRLLKKEIDLTAHFWWAVRPSCENHPYRKPQRLYMRNGIPISPTWWDRKWRAFSESGAGYITAIILKKVLKL